MKAGTDFVWIKREYFAVQKRMEILWKDAQRRASHKIPTLIHPLSTLRRERPTRIGMPAARQLLF